MKRCKMCNSQIGNDVKFCPNCGSTEFVEVQPGYPYSEETTVLETEPQQNVYSKPNINQTYDQPNFQQPYGISNNQISYGSLKKRKLKVWQILLIVLGAVLILGAGTFFFISNLSYETRTFVKEDSYMDDEIEITAKGDIIIKWKETVSFDKANSYYDNAVEYYEVLADEVVIYDFIDIDTDENDDEFIITVTIDELDNKNNLEKAVNEKLIALSGTENPDYLSMSLSAKGFKNAGYTEED